MDSLLEVFTAEHSGDAVALRAPGSPPATYDRAAFVQTVWKTGNYLRRLGAHADSTLAVPQSRNAAVPLAIAGGLLNGATVRLKPSFEVSAKLLVTPADEIGGFDLPPGAQRIAYDGTVDDPTVHDFGEGVWSENPFFPQDRVFLDDGVLADGDQRFDHADIVAAVEEILSTNAMERDTDIVLRTPLDDVRTIVAGLFAPLAAGATVRLIESDGDETTERGDLAVVERATDVPEASRIVLDRL